MTLSHGLTHPRQPDASTAAGTFAFVISIKPERARSSNSTSAPAFQPGRLNTCECVHVAEVTAALPASYQYICLSIGRLSWVSSLSPHPTQPVCFPFTLAEAERLKSTPDLGLTGRATRETNFLPKTGRNTVQFS